MLNICKDLMKKLQPLLSQFELDGNRNVWILKPGAKSRGRGIHCFDKLHAILKNSEEAGEGAMPIVQKYIGWNFKLIYLHFFSTIHFQNDHY